MMNTNFPKPVLQEGNFENSLFNQVQNECANSDFNDKSDGNIMDSFTHSSSSQEHTISYPEELTVENFKNLLSPLHLSLEEVNRSDHLIIDNILNGSPLQLGELADLSNSLFSTEGKEIFLEILLHLQLYHQIYSKLRKYS